MRIVQVRGLRLRRLRVRRVLVRRLRVRRLPVRPVLVRGLLLNPAATELEPLTRARPTGGPVFLFLVVPGDLVEIFLELGHLV